MYKLSYADKRKINKILKLVEVEHKKRKRLEAYEKVSKQRRSSSKRKPVKNRVRPRGSSNSSSPRAIVWARCHYCLEKYNSEAKAHHLSRCPAYRAKKKYSHDPSSLPSKKNSRQTHSSRTKVIKCPYCNLEINESYLREHKRKYHKKISTTLPEEAVVNTRLEPGSGGTCSLCNGTGGARGGCMRCDGSGWVSEDVISNSSIVTKDSQALSGRVSNSSHFPNNPGATFRERDGKLGSMPTYDDYSEESPS